jgi:hypothetical protein
LKRRSKSNSSKGGKNPYRATGLPVINMLW